jgi:hypothetical protein
VQSGPHDPSPDRGGAADRADRRADAADSAARRADIAAAAADALRDRSGLTGDELAAHARAASERSATAKQRWLDRARRSAAATKRAQEAETAGAVPAEVGRADQVAAQPERVCPTCGRRVDERFGLLVDGRWYHGAHLPALGA